MPEGMNVEISRKLTEQEEKEKEKGKEKRKARWEVLVEIVEVAVLAIVAVATAWSGYQAARWDGQQSLLYGHATTDRFKADAASTYGGQELAADSAIFTAYLQAGPLATASSRRSTFVVLPRTTRLPLRPG